jgi:hypothetical protein
VCSYCGYPEEREKIEQHWIDMHAKAHYYYPEAKYAIVFNRPPIEPLKYWGLML